MPQTPPPINFDRPRYAFDNMHSVNSDVLNMPLDDAWPPNVRVKMPSHHQELQSSQPPDRSTTPSSTTSTTITHNGPDVCPSHYNHSSPWSTSSSSRSSPAMNRYTDYVTYIGEKQTSSSTTTPLGLSSPIGLPLRSSSPFDDMSTPNNWLPASPLSHRHSLPYILQGFSREEPTSPQTRRSLSSDWSLWSPPGSTDSALGPSPYIDDSLSTSVTSLTLDRTDSMYDRPASTEFFRRSIQNANSTSPQSQQASYMLSPSSTRTKTSMFPSTNGRMPKDLSIDSATPPPGFFSPNVQPSLSSADSSMSSSMTSFIMDHSSKAPGSNMSWSAVVKAPARPPTIPVQSTMTSSVTPDRLYYLSSQHSHHDVGGMVSPHNYNPPTRLAHTLFSPSVHHQHIVQQRSESSTHRGRHSPSRSAASSTRCRGSPGSSGHFGDRKGPVGAALSTSHAMYASSQPPPFSLDGPSRRHINETLAARDLNPTHKQFNCRPTDARYFVIKSYTEDDVHKSLKYSIWASTEIGNRRLNHAFQESAHLGPIYLFFSVNASGHFCGCAEMISPVDWTQSSNVWLQGQKYRGTFAVRWIFVKDIPNSVLRHLRVVNNENKPVTNSRDTQELQPEVGREMLKCFVEYRPKTTLLDDFTWYDQREEDRRAAMEEGDERNDDFLGRGGDSYIGRETHANDSFGSGTSSATNSMDRKSTSSLI
ncbi:hypothetical protein SeLEV6574_g07408 [Synchytrium endobioticum]|uniref:YTH domain-containing protein n=1 Tax=Synchytrium endobioticum TaxID=286115 RepID=A0A507CDL2_9FUNG|nr:hypothetical protein SeLEV6574_g07408 [Synchytrium endobioticum]